MGGNALCAATCASCNSTASLATGRADEENLFDHQDAGVNQLDLRKSLEDLFHDKDKFAQFVDILDRHIR